MSVFPGRLAMDEKETSDDGMNMDDLHNNQKDTVELDGLYAAMTYGIRRKSKKIKKRGRRKGSKKKISSEITRKLGDATRYYAHGQYEEVIPLLKEIILILPNLAEAYYTLGLVYNAMGDKKRAIEIYMLAVHLTPKDASLWKLLVTWSLEQGDRGRARYCLDQAIKADPEDMGLRYRRDSLFLELGEDQKAADESYDQISKNLEAGASGSTTNPVEHESGTYQVASSGS